MGSGCRVEPNLEAAWSLPLEQIRGSGFRLWDLGFEVCDGKATPKP